MNSPGDRCFVAQVPLDEFNLVQNSFEVMNVACRQIIEHAHVIPASHQTPSQMRPNKACSSGHQTVGHEIPLIFVKM
jgi:hypothetical protein